MYEDNSLNLAFVWCDYQLNLKDFGVRKSKWRHCRMTQLCFCCVSALGPVWPSATFGPTRANGLMLQAARTKNISVSTIRPQHQSIALKPIHYMPSWCKGRPSSTHFTSKQEIQVEISCNQVCDLQQNTWGNGMWQKPKFNSIQFNSIQFNSIVFI